MQFLPETCRDLSEVEGDEMARNASMSVSSAPPRSGLLVDGVELTRDFARELQADNDELRETNCQLIAALEEIQSLNVTLQSVNEALHTTNVELRTELDQSRSRVGDLEHMLNGIGVAVLLLSEDLELRDYNATASRFFALKRQDIGRSIARVRHDFVQTSLPELCREALDGGEPLERIANAAAGDLVSLRIREVDLGASSAGLLLTITEISDLGLDPQSQFA
jgi:nitrogen fixation/metabolism regulation signal transduction histidine kinase